MEATVVSWNIAHQTRERAIPPSFYEVVDHLRPDVLVLNEFVGGPSRKELRDRLEELGFVCGHVSERINRSNQVLIAARKPVEQGDLRSPMQGTVAPANWLHARVPDLGFDIVGFRMPWWKTAAERRAYRSELAGILAASTSRPLVLCGDFNDNPFHRLGAEVSEVPWLGLEEFTVTRPLGDWSYISKSGASRTCIDHVAASAGVRISDVRYITSVGDVVLAGPSADAPISDHAALQFKVSL